MLWRIVSFMIQGVWPEKAIPKGACVVMEPRHIFVSPSILARSVDFPDATGPTMAVSPEGMVNVRPRITGSDVSADHEITASWKNAMLCFDPVFGEG